MQVKQHAAPDGIMEGRKGTLEPGKLADLVVLSADYVAVAEDQIKDIKAEVTDSSRRSSYFSAKQRHRIARP